ncbi:MAG: MerR family transcriptional regulator [Pseudomonadota bacterium]
MTKWYVKDLSKLTGVSVQALHHYDRIDLLKPSYRLENGYRLYSESDLLRLQQIIALKFFGFELNQIKILLTNDNVKAAEHLIKQAKFLKEKAKTLLEASKVLEGITSDCDHDKSIPWETIIKIIEVYSMAKNLEHSWVKEIFTPDELKQYADFESELKNKFSEGELGQRWGAMMSDINANLEADPKSAIGITLGGRWMNLINEMYGKKYAHLRTKKFKQGFMKGKGLEDIGLTIESVGWVDSAIDAYWKDRFRKILAKVGSGIPDDEIFHLWNEAVMDLYGDDNTRKKEIYDMVLSDDQVSEKAKEWLRTLQELTAANRHLL